MHTEGVFHETIDRIAIGPPAALFQSLGYIPVVQREPGHDFLLEEGIHEAGVEVQTRWIDRSPIWPHARPSHGEAIRIQVEVFHECHIIAVTVVVVGGDGSIITVHDCPGYAAELIPDGVGAPVSRGSTLNLERCGS